MNKNDSGNLFLAGTIVLAVLMFSFSRSIGADFVPTAHALLATAIFGALAFFLWFKLFKDKGLDGFLGAFTGFLFIAGLFWGEVLDSIAVNKSKLISASLDIQTFGFQEADFWFNSWWFKTGFEVIFLAGAIHFSLRALQRNSW